MIVRSNHGCVWTTMEKRAKYLESKERTKQDQDTQKQDPTSA